MKSSYSRKYVLRIPVDVIQMLPVFNKCTLLRDRSETPTAVLNRDRSQEVRAPANEDDLIEALELEPWTSAWDIAARDLRLHQTSEGYVKISVIHTTTHGQHVSDHLRQRFSNFFQVGTTFISQNVLRTTLLLNVLSIC
jgi:hypothetical protein